MYANSSRVSPIISLYNKTSQERFIIFGTYHFFTSFPRLFPDTKDLDNRDVLFVLSRTSRGLRNNATDQIQQCGKRFSGTKERCPRCEMSLKEKHPLRWLKVGIMLIVLGGFCGVLSAIHFQKEKNHLFI